MKKGIWAALALLLLAAAGWWAYTKAPAFLKKKGREEVKTYQIDKIRITEASFKKEDFVIGGTIKLDHPLPGANIVDIGGINLRARFANKLTAPVTLLPGADLQTFAFTTRVEGNKFVNLIRYMQGQDSMYVVLSALIPLTLPVIGRQEIKIEHDTLRWPTFKFPKIRLGSPHFDKVGLRHSDIHIPLYFHNLESNTLRVSKAAFTIRLDPVSRIDMEQLPPLVLHPHGRDTVNLIAHLTWQKPLKTAVEIITNKDRYWADISGRIEMAIDGPSSHVKIPVEIKDHQRIELLPDREKRQEIRELNLVRKKK